MKRRQFLKIALGAALAAASYPIIIERIWVQVNHYRLRIENLPQSFIGFKIAHLTDIHLGTLVSERFIEKVIKKTNRLGADVIVCTGDYVHARNSTSEIDRVWKLLNQLHAADGVYSILGNHDHWADSTRSIELLERSGQSVRHKSRTITRNGEKLVIGGSGDYWEDELGIDKAFTGVDPESCKILLTHNPDSIDTAFMTNLSLAISGHTHGGQVSVPFYGPPILPVTNKKYSSGIIATSKCQLFISRGIGWAIVPVRFNCYPEIAVLELT